MPKCGHCGHTEHTGVCRRRATSKCQPIPHGFICGFRPPCPCPFRTCKCGLALAVAVELPAGVMLPPAGQVVAVSVVRGTAMRPDGRLAVWRLANGMLGCRDLPEGADPGEGEWRAVEHDETVCGYDLQLVAVS